LNPKKWETLVSETFRFLGFEIDTNQMTVSWPLDKRQALYDLLQEIRSRTGSKKFVKPREMAKLTGILRSASSVSPWGTFLSFNLQNALTQASKHAFSSERAWWNRGKIRISAVATATINQLMETLLADVHRNLWTRPIALILQRDHSHRVYSDASYLGIGGWSPCFRFVWRITRADLERLGFRLQDTNSYKTTMYVDQDGTTSMSPLHINPLEFIAALVNLWLSLRFIVRLGPRVGGYILGLFSDNTTALAWMSLASRTPDPLLQGLARLGSALLVHANRLLTKVDPVHIAGVQNREADALSRPMEKAATQELESLTSVFNECSRLQTCQVYLLPSPLLRTIASICSGQPIEGTYDELTTNLLTLEERGSPLGADLSGLQSTIYDP
jgi:hypothetical protein